MTSPRPSTCPPRFPRCCPTATARRTTSATSAATSTSAAACRLTSGWTSATASSMPSARSWLCGSTTTAPGTARTPARSFPSTSSAPSRSLTTTPSLWTTAVPWATAPSPWAPRATSISTTIMAAGKARTPSPSHPILTNTMRSTMPSTSPIGTRRSRRSPTSTSMRTGRASSCFVRIR